MGQREPRSPDEVQAAVAHVCYELQTMVEQFAEARKAQQAGTQPQRMVNAFFEASLLHARNLIEFLASGKPRKTRMHPHDFGTSWRGTLRNNDYRAFADHHLSHLLWERVTEPLPDWPGLEPLVENLLELFDDFVGSLDDPQLFRPCLDVAKQMWSDRAVSREPFATFTTAAATVPLIRGPRPTSL